ncbi:hypothetical protein HK096_008702, partial [Nowakowskiella sp. JEL0078]
MSPAFDEATNLLAYVKSILASKSQNLDSAGSILSKLKSIGEILETGAQWSTKANDIPAFERYISQLKTYYSDYGSIQPPSPFLYPLLGLNLLCLLSQNRIAEFHTELELIQPDEPNNKFVSHPIIIEQCLMEGSYNKVWNACASVPAE